MEQQFISPIKTLHGTNPETLQGDYIRAMQKVREAIECFNTIEFNGRDYANFETFCKAKDNSKNKHNEHKHLNFSSRKNFLNSWKHQHQLERR